MANVTSVLARRQRLEADDTVAHEEREAVAVGGGKLVVAEVDLEPPRDHRAFGLVSSHRETRVVHEGLDGSLSSRAITRRIR
jgi:hypothetical protein